MWMMHGASGGGCGRLSTGRRRIFRWAAPAAFGPVGEPSGLDADQRAWLLDELRQDLDAQIEDAEEGGVDRQAAERMAAVRAIVLWLQGRGAPPGAPGVEYLEQCLRSIYRRPTDRELFQWKVYLATIGELGGDVRAASRLWQEPFGLGDPAEQRKISAFQGRKLRSLMRESGISIGEVAGRSEIDVALLISFLFGLDGRIDGAILRHPGDRGEELLSRGT